MNNAELDELIREPRESLDVEVKNWLDLSNADHRAIVAKEIIALANHGGGFLVIGFDEHEDGSLHPSPSRPDTLTAWSQDGIQSIVSKYVDPVIQCRVTHRGTDEAKHPIIIVPGGHRVPIRSRSGSPDGKLQVHRIYIRRPGPASEEPRSAEEWDRFLERCLKNRQVELVEAMRAILSGTLPSQPIPTLVDTLSAFSTAAIDHWEKRVSGLPHDAPPRLPHGFCDFAAAIEGNFSRPTLRDLRRMIASEVRSHSGWPPFLTIDRAPYTPVPIDGAIDCWIGPDSDGSVSGPAHHDYWRVSPDGLLFTRRGYDEDGGLRDRTPGTSLDITTPAWRIGEAILAASYIAHGLSADGCNLIVRIRYTGLAGRELVSYGNPSRMLRRGYRAMQSDYEATQTISLSALPQNLPEAVYALLSPLYELFGFFQLPKRLVEEELAQLLRHTYS